MITIYIFLFFGNLVFRASGAALAEEAVYRPARIVNGRDVLEGEAPWQISLQMSYNEKSRSHFCGGALVGPLWVVTAAHCVKKSYITPKSLVIVFNSIDMKIESAPVREVVKIIIADYDDKTKVNDIALLKLKEPVTIEGLAHLPSENYKAKGTCIVSGWGYEKVSSYLMPDQLKAANVTVLSDERCQELFGPKHTIHPNMLCAGGGDTDACQGDSGGPLVCKGADNKPILAGVVSWGIGCATIDIPGVYTEVSKYRRWIDEHIQSN